MRAATTFLIAILALPQVVLSQDRIDRVEGAPVAGVTVVKENFLKVTYRRRTGSPQDIAAHQVVDILRGDAPTAYREGLAKLLSGDLKNAAGLLQLVAAEGGERPWIKEYASFYLGEARRQLGETNAAVQAYEAVLQLKPDSRFLPRVRLALARTHAASGSYSRAGKILKDFVKEVDTKRLPRHHALMARQLLGRNLVAQKNYTQATREYDGVITQARSQATKTTDPAEKRVLELVEIRAIRDKGSALVKDKKYSLAESLFTKLGAERPDDSVAATVALLGEAEVNLGKGNPDLARVQLSKVVALQFRAEEERPRALLLLAETYAALGGKGEKGAGKLARIYIDDLLKNYPGSEEAKLGSALLQRL